MVFVDAGLKSCLVLDEALCRDVEYRSGLL